MFKVIVAGSRNFNNYKLLESEIVKFIKPVGLNEVEIVSGTARGADKLGEKFAKEKGCVLQQFLADWNTYGKSAGYRRNADMAKYADACVVFWDGKSKGTKHMIDLAKKSNIELKVIRINIAQSDQTIL